MTVRKINLLNTTINDWRIVTNRNAVEIGDLAAYNTVISPVDTETVGVSSTTVINVTSGTASGFSAAPFTAVINNSGGHAIGATSITVDDASDIIAGDFLRNGTGLIRISSIASDTLTLAGGLTAAVADDAEVDIVRTNIGHSIRIGDHIREISSISGDAITITPALAAAPAAGIPVSGYGSAAVTQSDNSNSGFSGTQARFTISAVDPASQTDASDNLEFADYTFRIVSGGTGYTANDRLTVSGAVLGGTSPAHDAVITVLTVSSGVIQTASISGSPGIVITDALGALRTNIGDLSGLTVDSDHRGSLVDAVNEVKAIAESGGIGSFMRIGGQDTMTGLLTVDDLGIASGSYDLLLKSGSSSLRMQSGGSNADRLVINSAGRIGMGKSPHGTHAVDVQGTLNADTLRQSGTELDRLYLTANFQAAAGSAAEKRIVAGNASLTGKIDITHDNASTQTASGSTVTVIQVDSAAGFRVGQTITVGDNNPKRIKSITGNAITLASALASAPAADVAVTFQGSISIGGFLVSDTATGFRDRMRALVNTMVTDGVFTAASTTQAGISEYSTRAEINAPSPSNSLSVTPYALAGRTATETRSGLVKLSTDSLADGGTDDETAMTPEMVKRRIDAIDLSTDISAEDVIGRWNKRTASGNTVTAGQYKIDIQGNTKTLYIHDTSADSTPLTIGADTFANKDLISLGSGLLVRAASDPVESSSIVSFIITDEIGTATNNAAPSAVDMGRRLNDMIQPAGDIPDSSIADAKISGTLSAGKIPNLNASKINAGTLDLARLPSIPSSKIDSDAVTGDKIAARAVGPAQLGASIGSTAGKTANYTLVAADRGKMIRLTGTNARTFTLPDITGDVAVGWEVWIANDSSAVLTLDGNGSDTIDGTATYAVSAGSSVLIQVTGTTAWKVRASGIPGDGTITAAKLDADTDTKKKAFRNKIDAMSGEIVTTLDMSAANGTVVFYGGDTLKRFNNDDTEISLTSLTPSFYSGIGVHNNGDVCILDTNNRKFLTYDTSAGTWDSGISTPSGTTFLRSLTVTTDSDVIISDDETDKIYTYDGTNWDAGIDYPGSYHCSDIQVDSENRIYFLRSNSTKIYRYENSNWNEIHYTDSNGISNFLVDDSGYIIFNSSLGGLSFLAMERGQYPYAPSAYGLRKVIATGSNRGYAMKRNSGDIYRMVWQDSHNVKKIIIYSMSNNQYPYDRGIVYKDSTGWRNF